MTNEPEATAQDERFVPIEELIAANPALRNGRQRPSWLRRGGRHRATVSRRRQRQAVQDSLA